MNKAILHWGPIISLPVIHLWSKTAEEFRSGLLLALCAVLWFGMTYIVEILENKHDRVNKNNNINSGCPSRGIPVSKKL